MRIRTIKPEFWQNEDLVKVSDKARLLAAGILNYADDEGYFKAKAELVRAAIFPLEEQVNAGALLLELAGINYLDLAEGTDGREYGRVINFNLHQRIDKPRESILRALMEPSAPCRLRLPVGREGKGRERKGGEAPPLFLNELKAQKDSTQRLFDRIADKPAPQGPIERKRLRAQILALDEQIANFGKKPANTAGN